MEHNKSELRSFHLFAGAGGGLLADILLGHRIVGACEIEKYPRDVMLQRQHDGIFPEFPIWDDVRTFDGKQWRGTVDVICGGFPCQDISAAGKGAGLSGNRSGLWFEFARIINEIKPKFVFIENSPLLRTRGLNRVLQDLTKMGYNARWGVLGAWHVGANHKRDRMWILAYSNMHEYRTNSREEGETQSLQKKHREEGFTRRTSRTSNDKEILADSKCYGLQGIRKNRKTQGSTGLCNGKGSDKNQCISDTWNNRNEQRIRELQCSEQTIRSRTNHRRRTQINASGEWWKVEPDVGRVVDGMASRANRLKAIGNGQVPLVAATAFNILSKGLI